MSAHRSRRACPGSVPLLLALFLVLMAVVATLVSCGPSLLEVSQSLVDGYAEMAAGGVVYVHPDGSSENPGTQAAPKASIEAALDLAALLMDSGEVGTPEVRVAEGDYNEPHGVQVPAGVRLLGGYHAVTWDRDPATNITQITRETAGAVIAIESGAGAETMIDGFAITCPSSSEPIGIDCTEASPVITRCTIDVTAGGELSAGIALETSDAVVDGNTIRCGGADTASWGIVCKGGQPSLWNNVITVVAGTGATVPIHASGLAEPLIMNNTVHGGLLPDDALLFLSTGSAVVENNIFLASTSCAAVWSAGAGMEPVSLKNNLFITCTDPILHTGDGSDLVTVGAVETHLGTAALDNAEGLNPGFTDPASGDYHITADVISGIDLSGHFSADRDGVPRTAPWSVGAYELD